MARLRFAHRMNHSSDVVWASICDPQHLFKVTRPLLRLKPRGSVPERFRGNDTVVVQLIYSEILPANDHTIYFEEFDDQKQMYQTREHGGAIRMWNHHFWIERTSPTSCICHDEILVEAGAMTPILWCYAQGLYRWRYLRRKMLLKSMG